MLVKEDGVKFINNKESTLLQDRFLGSLIGLFFITGISYFDLKAQDNIEVPAVTVIPEEVTQESKEKVKEDPLKDLPQTGVIASVGGAGRGTQVTGFGSVNLEDKTEIPIAGSVVRSGNSWIVKVKNNVDKSLTVNTVLKQFKDVSKAVQSKYITFSLAGKEEETREVSNSFSADGCTLEITSWSK
jgi:hypothetical protein